MRRGGWHRCDQDKLFDDLAVTDRQLLRDHPAHRNTQHGGPIDAARGLSFDAVFVLHQLRRKQYTDFWPKDGISEVLDSDIARDIGQKVDGGKKRFPLVIRINQNARNAEPPEHYVMQKNEYDILFLLKRARRHGYVVAVEEVEGQKEKQRSWPTRNM